MKVCIIGDIHGNFPKLDEILEETVADLYLQVGDLGAIDDIDDNSYTPFQKPIYFIPGNHESWDEIEKFHDSDINNIPEIRKNLFLIPFGHWFIHKGLKIGGLGGNYSMKRFTWYRGQLQHERRKHYVISDVKKMMTANSVDILLTHEAPYPFKYFPGMEDMGRPEINTILEKLKPKYHFFGHHHKYWRNELYGGVSTCIPLCEYRIYEMGNDEE